MNHFERLIRLYASAPIHNFYSGIKMDLDAELCQISLKIYPKYFHGGSAVHGSVYFKLLDDTCYFKCQAHVHDYFLLTKSFQIELKRPLTEGTIVSIAQSVEIIDNGFKSSAILYDERHKIAATGEGIFVKSKTPLLNISAYAD